MFTDVVASTEFRRTRGDDRADEVRRRHDEAVRAAAADHLGEIVKGTGDGFLVVFPAAAEGIAGAVAMQRAIDRLSRGLPDGNIAIRVGLSAGDVVLEDDDCFGTPVVEAARLCDAAEPTAILVSEVVRLLAGSRGGHRLEPVGMLELKGLGELNAFEVLWEPERDGADVPLPHPLMTGDTLRLVGRDEELDAVRTACKEAAAGHPKVVLISGEPGVGKTRLAAEAARAAHETEAVVLFGRCDEDLSVPYQPFVEAFGAYAASCDDERLLHQLGSVGGELVRLVPALAGRFGGRLDEPVGADAETERFRLFEAATTFLHAIAQDHAVVLVVDDAHWGARPTLLLLRHLVRARGNERLAILVTYRDTDLSRSHPLAEVLADLRREDDVTRVVLRGLSADEVTELVSAAAGHELDDTARSFAEDVHAETEGNPFFVGQVLRHLTESGAIHREDDRWVIERRSAIGIPEGVREVIGKRLSHLSAQANDVLAVAAVIGREFDRRLVAEASGADADTVLDALEEAEASRLVVPIAGRHDRLGFTHALVRSTLYGEIATTRRLRMHQRVADALEARAARGVHCVEELAHHSREAAALGDVHRAIRWSRAAAGSATERLAYEEAASHYQEALDVLDPDDRSQLELRAELRTELARAFRTAGSVATSRETALRAVAEARVAGRFDLLLDATLVIAGDRGWSEAGRVDRDVIDLFEEGLEQLASSGDSPVKAKAMGRLASELYFDVPSADRRQQLTADALAMAERLGDDDTTVFVVWWSLWGGWVPGNAGFRRARSLELVDIGRRTGNRLHELIGHLWSVAALAELGDGVGLRAEIAIGRSIAEELRIPEWLWVSGVHLSAIAFMEQRYDEAMALAGDALQVGTAIGSETAMQMYGVSMFTDARARGGFEAILPLLESMVEQYPLIPAWRCGLAAAYRELGRADDAVAVFQSFAREGFRGIPLDANWVIGAGLLATVAEFVPDDAQVAALYEVMLPYADCVMYAGMPSDVLAAIRVPLMMVAARLGRWDEACEHYEAAQATHDRLACPAATLLADLEWARLLRRRGGAGDSAAAGELASSCAVRAAAVGAVRLETLAHELLRSP